MTGMKCGLTSITTQKSEKYGPSVVDLCLSCLTYHIWIYGIQLKFEWVYQNVSHIVQLHSSNLLTKKMRHFYSQVLVCAACSNLWFSVKYITFLVSRGAKLVHHISANAETSNCNLGFFSIFYIQLRCSSLWVITFSLIMN